MQIDSVPLASSFLLVVLETKSPEEWTASKDGHDDVGTLID